MPKSSLRTAWAPSDKEQHYLQVLLSRQRPIAAWHRTEVQGRGERAAKRRRQLPTPSN